MAIKDGEHIDGAIEKIKSLASDGTEADHELNATYFHGKEIGSFITAEGGGSTAGAISSSYASGTWITSASKAALTCEYSTYGGIFSAATKSGRVSLATYPDSSNGDDKVYLNYFTADQIAAGTNSANKQLYGDAPTNALYANAFVGSLSGNASSASVAASVSDYNSTSEPIYIGFRGDSLTSCEYLAAYGTTSSGARCIKDISPSNVTVGSANYATSAGSATKATQDANGSDIAGTYVKGSDANVRTHALGSYASDGTRYYKLATLPTYDNAGNYASINAAITLGGGEANQRRFLSANISNRNLLGVNGTCVGSDPYGKCDLVIFANSDSTHTVYLKCSSYFLFDAVMSCECGATDVYDGTYTLSPSGSQAGALSENMSVLKPVMKSECSYDSSSGVLTLSL